MNTHLPPPPRFLPGQRWLNIGFRCAHLIGVAGVGGGFLFALPEAQWLGYWYLTLGSGVALVMLYLWTDFSWLRQLKGQAVIAKIGLLALAAALPAWRGALFMLIIILSGLFAHAPARLRDYAWGRKVRACGTQAIEEKLK